MPATYCPEKGDRCVTFFRNERYLVHTISAVDIYIESENHDDSATAGGA